MLLWLGVANYKANVNTVSYFCQGANWKFYMMLFSWMVIEIIDKISHSVRFFLVQSCGYVRLTQCAMLIALCVVMGKSPCLLSYAFLNTVQLAKTNFCGGVYCKKHLTPIVLFACF